MMRFAFMTSMAVRIAFARLKVENPRLVAPGGLPHMDEVESIQHANCTFSVVTRCAGPGCVKRSTPGDIWPSDKCRKSDDAMLDDHAFVNLNLQAVEEVAKGLHTICRQKTKPITCARRATLMSRSTQFVLKSQSTGRALTKKQKNMLQKAVISIGGAEATSMLKVAKAMGRDEKGTAADPEGKLKELAAVVVDLYTGDNAKKRAAFAKADKLAAEKVTTTLTKNELAAAEARAEEIMKKHVGTAAVNDGGAEYFDKVMQKIPTDNTTIGQASSLMELGEQSLSKQRLGPLIFFKFPAYIFTALIASIACTLSIFTIPFFAPQVILFWTAVLTWQIFSMIVLL